MSIDILGTSWDQFVSMVQCCFMSTETLRLVRMDSHLDSRTAPEICLPHTIHKHVIYTPVDVYRTYAHRNDLPRFVKQTKNTFTSSYTLGNIGHNLNVRKRCISVSKCVSYYACTSWADGIKRFVGLWCTTENTFSADPILQSCALCSALSW